MSPEAPLGTGRVSLNLNDVRASVVQPSLPEGEEVTGDVPAEPVRTGWSSMQYIQPAGFSASELTFFTRGYYGCNMFHLALGERAGVDGKENHAVIRYLVDMFGPKLVLTPHQKRLNRLDRPSLYEGKTPLHQAVLAHDVKLVQFFVERGAFVRARCTGSFFGATSHAYYGEYPLSFAVCTGQKEVARYLADNGAAVNEDHDVHRCYALHMAVRSDAIASAPAPGAPREGPFPFVMPRGSREDAFDQTVGRCRDRSGTIASQCGLPQEAVSGLSPRTARQRALEHARWAHHVCCCFLPDLSCHALGSGWPWPPIKKKKFISNS